MRNSTAARRLGAAAALLVLGGALGAGADPAAWPAYRGPAHDGRSAETGLLESWPPEGPQVLWRVKLGTGYSGISVVDGRAYTLFGDGDSEYALCVDAATGKEIWRHRLDSDRRDSQGSGPRSTPTVDGGLVYALGARGKLAALEAAGGKPAWELDLVRELGARVPQWGVSTSPMVYGDLLLVDVGGRESYSLVAFDKKSGAVRWHSQTDGAGYSTPLVIEVGGMRQALFFTASGLVAVAADSGRLYWRYPWKTSYDVNAAMPVFVPPDKVFISSSYDSGAALLRIRLNEVKSGVEVVWRSRVMKNHFNSSILLDGHLYGFDNTILKCIEAATGEEKWAERGFSRGSILYADGDLYVLSQRGLLARVAATPEGYREEARAQILSGKTWTMPTLAEGRLFLRSHEEMVALDLRP